MQDELIDSLNSWLEIKYIFILFSITNTGSVLT